MTESIDIRWKQRFQNFEKAYRRLRQGLLTLSREPDNELMQAGLIQMFGFSFELAWKVLKDFLEEEGFTVPSPKATLRQAFQSGYVDDGEAWLQALQDRNMTTHTYDEETATAVVNDIRTRYVPMLDKFYQVFKARL